MVVDDFDVINAEQKDFSAVVRDQNEVTEKVLSNPINVLEEKEKVHDDGVHNNVVKDKVMNFNNKERNTMKVINNY